MKWLVTGTLVASCGCVSVSFVRTDPSFETRDFGYRPVEAHCSNGRPVYIDRLPARELRSVGVFEMTFAPETPLSTVIHAAGCVAAEIGCTVAVDRAVWGARVSDLPRTSVHLTRHHGPSAPSAGIWVSSLPPGKRELICAVHAGATVGREL